MTEELKKRIRFWLVILALFVVVFNVYYYLTETYVTVRDNVNDERVLSIKYSEILNEEESFSNQLSLYVMGEPAKDDSALFETLGVAGLGIGAILCLAGAYSLSVNHKFNLLVIGVLAGCLGSCSLYMIINVTEKTIRESFVGTIESIFGKGSFLDIETTSFTLMIINVLVGAAVCGLTYYYLKNSKTAVSEKQEQNFENNEGVEN